MAIDTNIGVDAYREHRFLDHRKVPNVMRKSKSPLIQIASNVVDAKSKDGMSSFLRFSPQNVLLGPTFDEIIEWFSRGSPSHYSILRFQSLFNNTVRCSTWAGEEFKRKFELAQARIAKALRIMKTP